jgi:diguanylate cyclase (GGDEF)-like protein
VPLLSSFVQQLWKCLETMALRRRSWEWARASLQPATLLGLMMIAACWLGIGFVLSIEYSKATDNAAQQADNLSHLFEQNITNAFKGVDRGLMLLREAYERDPEHFDLLEWTRQTGVIGDLTLQLTIIDPDGFSSATTFSGATAPLAHVYLGDREHFMAQATSQGDDFFIGTPVIGRISGKWTIQVSRRLHRPDGSFGGTLVASLDPAFIERFFDAVDLGPQGSVLLRRVDGVVLVSRGLKQVVGSQVKLPMLPKALLESPVGHYWGRGAIDGVNRLVGYRADATFPLQLLVGLAESHIYESYWRNRTTYVIFAAIVTVLILLGVVAGIRHQMRLDRIRDELRRSETQARLKTRELEVTLDHMGQGIIMTDADNNVPVINRRAVELLGMTHQLASSSGGQLRPDFGAFPAEKTPASGMPASAIYSHVTADGTVLEFHQTPLPDGGAVRTITDVTQRKRAEQEILRLAHHDALTGLANRNLLHRCIAQAVEGARGSGDEFAVLTIDLDRFKTVNDTLGHSVGDELLRQIAGRLTSCVGEADTVARIGGDEFVILRPLVNGAADASALAERIQQLAAEPYRVLGNHIAIGTSIGIALAPQDGATVDRLLGNSDLALYRAKAEGRNGFCFFNADIEKVALARYRFERELPLALERAEFELYYQPSVTLADGSFTSCEALLRWRHPTLGIIGPSEFISVAEDIGIIGQLGDWVLQRACRDAVSWPRHLKLAVNLSAAQFLVGDLFGNVVSALASAGLPPNRLELEITESLLLDDYEGTLATLHRLRAHGVSIALDDFGTGYSSLTYLRQFPFDRIKIDRIFVAEMTTRADCAAIVMAVAGLGRSLGVGITAEGVECEDQLTMLKAAGCTDAQGYLFCTPQPADRTREILYGAVAATRIAS